MADDQTPQPPRDAPEPEPSDLLAPDEPETPPDEPDRPAEKQVPPEPPLRAEPGPAFPTATAALTLVVSAWALLTGFLFWAPHNIDRRDQAKQVLYIIDASENGHVLLPKETGHWPTKPQLYTWLSMVFARAEGGVTEDNARYVSALAMLAVALLVFHLAKGIGGPPLALGASLAFLANRHTATVGGVARTDMLLTALVFGALACFAGSLREPDRRKGWLLGMWILIGLATLTKGPVGLLLPLLTALIFLAAGRRWRDIARLGWWPGLAIALGIFLAWFIPAALVGGRPFLDVVLFRELGGRLTGEGRPLRLLTELPYYLPRLAYAIVPWTFVLPMALWQERREKRVPLLLVFILVVFVFFSLIPAGKRIDHIYPLVPAAAILIAAHVLSLGRGARTATFIAAIPMGLFGLVLLMGAAVPGAIVKLVAWSGHILAKLEYKDTAGLQAALGRWRIALLAAGLLLAGGALIALLGHARRRGAAMLAGLVLMSAGTIVLAGTAMSPSAFNNTVAAHERFCSRMRTLIPPDADLVITRGVYRSVAVKLHHNAPFVRPDALPRRMAASDKPLLIIIRQKDLQALSPRLRARFEELCRSEPFGRKKKRRTLVALIERPESARAPVPQSMKNRPKGDDKDDPDLDNP